LVIVDVETTGQSAMFGKVIEIAALRVENGKVVRSIETLINPERYISPTIESLTGINNTMVAGAPVFADVARELRGLFEGALFVAHNARFDYGFLKSEFASLGLGFQARCLCTVKLSRKLFPRFRHHDLSSVITRHDLSCENRHRASGDATAVLAFLHHIHSHCEPEQTALALKHVLKSEKLPPGVERVTLDALPEASGVYTFYGKEGELLYVGKSVNIKDRVRSHFSGEGTSARSLEMSGQVHKIESIATAGELGALLLESRMIKELAPLYNRMSRERRYLVVARRVTDPRGYATIVLENVEYIDLGEAETIMGVFKTKKQAQEFLALSAKTFQLCQKLLGLDQSRGHCFGYQLQQCRGACAGEEAVEEYNRRVEEAFEERRIKAWPYSGGLSIEEQGEHLREMFVVDNWCLLASYRTSGDGFENVQRGSHRFDYDSYKILLRYLQQRRATTRVRIIRRDEMTRLLREIGETDEVPAQS
jgi:DNA polymerase III subunit epsilon